MQTLCLIMIVDCYLYPKTKAGDNLNKFLLKRFLAFNLFFIPNICLIIAGYGRKKADGYWKDMVYLGIFAWMVIIYLGFGYLHKWFLDLNGSIFNEMSDHQFYSCYAGIIVSGFLIICTSSRRFLVPKFPFGFLLTFFRGLSSCCLVTP